MKKEYKTPSVQSSEKAEKWAPALAMVAGYAVGRAVTNAIKIDSLQKVSSLLPILTEVK